LGDKNESIHHGSNLSRIGIKTKIKIINGTGS